jgi:ataxia telangiectasia mutated family protein
LQAHASQHLLANHSTWAYAELAAAVLCLRASTPQASALPASSGAGSGSGGGGGGGSAAKRQRTASSSAPACPYLAVSTGLAQGPEHAVYWLQVLSSMLHNPAGFGKVAALRFKEVDPSILVTIVEQLTHIIMNIGSANDGQGADTCGWVIQCLAALCDGAGTNDVGGDGETAEVAVGNTLAAGGGSSSGAVGMAIPWEKVWDAIIPTLRPSSRLSTADKARGGQLLRSLLRTGTVDVERVLAKFDPLRVLVAEKDLSAWQSLILTIAYTSPGHLHGAIDCILDRFVAVTDKVTAGMKAMALDAIATASPLKMCVGAPPLRPKVSSELTALTASDRKTERELAAALRALQRCHIVVSRGLYASALPPDVTAPRWPGVPGIAPMLNPTEAAVGWHGTQMETVAETVQFLVAKCAAVLAVNFVEVAKEISTSSRIDFAKAEVWKGVRDAAHLCALIDRYLFYIKRRSADDTDSEFNDKCALLDQHGGKVGGNVCNLLTRYCAITKAQHQGITDLPHHKDASAVVTQLGQLMCVEASTTDWRSTEMSSNAKSGAIHVYSLLQMSDFVDHLLRPTCILTQITTVALGIATIFLQCTEQVDEDDEMEVVDDFAVPTAQSATNTTTTSEDETSDGITPSSDVQHLWLACVDVQHWVRFVGCHVLPLSAIFNEDSHTWGSWGDIYDSWDDNRKANLPVCVSLAACYSVAPAVQVLCRHPGTVGAQFGIDELDETVEKVLANLRSHQNFYRSDVRCEVLRATTALARISATTVKLNTLQVGGFQLHLQKLYQAFCSEHGQGGNSTKPFMLQPEERRLLAICLADCVVHAADELNTLLQLDTKDVSVTPIDSIVKFFHDNLTGVSILNLDLISVLFTALEKHPTHARELAGKLGNLLDDQLADWTECQQKSAGKDEGPGAMFRADPQSVELKKHCDQGMAIWALLACGELAKAYPPLEDYLIVTLCRYGRLKDTTRTVVAAILQDIAISLGHASSVTFLSERHLVNLISYWLSSDVCNKADFTKAIEKSQFVTFPFHLLSADLMKEICSSPTLRALRLDDARRLQYLKAFVNEHAGTFLSLLVGELVTRRSIEGGGAAYAAKFKWLEDLPALTGSKTAQVLVDAHVGRILGWTLPLITKGGLLEQAYQGFLGTYIGKQTSSAFTGARLGEIFVELLAVVSIDGDDGGDVTYLGEMAYACHSVMQEEVDRVTQWMNDSFKCIREEHASVDRFLLSNESASAQGILLRLAVRIAEATRTSQQTDAFMAFEYAVLHTLALPRNLKDADFCASQDFAPGFYLRDIIGTLVRTITTCPHLLPQCCKMLQLICEAALPLHAATIGPLLRQIIGALLDHAPIDSENPSSEWKIANAEQLIEFLVLKGPADGLELFRRKLIPFPEYKGARLVAIRDSHLELRGAISIEEELTNFLDSNGQRLSAASQMLEIGHLKDVFCDNKALLSLPSVQALIPDVVGEIFARCRKSDDSGKDVAAQCLGELGAYNMDMVALPQRHADLLRKPTGKMVASETWENLAEVFEPYVVEHLIDMNAHIVEAAASCLNGLLCEMTHEDQDMKDRAGPLLTNELRWLTRKEPSNVRNMIKQWGAAEKAPFSWDAAWSPFKIDYDTWIKRLTHVLITPSNCSATNGGCDNMGLEGSLACLLPLCHQRAEICEDVLPHIFLALLRRDPERARFKKLSRRMNEFFRKVNALTSNQRYNQTLQKSIGTMINVVNVLRCTKCEKSVSRGTAGGGGKRQRTSTSAAGVTHWDSLQWLDLDFLEVAKAAAACSAHFTATFYAELWCDMKQIPIDALVHPTRGHQACTPGQLTQCRDLLVEASQGIGEPDSIYGILHTALETASLVQLYEHEGEFHRAMSIHDFGSRRAPEAGTSSRFTPALSAQTLGIARGLRSLGYTHVLGTFLDGAVGSATPAHVHAELADHQFASAWRNAVWDPAGLDRTQAGWRTNNLSSFTQTFGVSHSICRALACFAATNQKNQLEQIGKDARGLIMREVLASSTESVSSLYPALVQLQSFVEIEEASMLEEDGSLETSWGARLATTEVGWGTQEPILALRSVLLGLGLRRSCSTDQGGGSNSSGGPGGGLTALSSTTHRFSTFLAKVLEDQARIGRNCGQTATAFTAAAMMETLCLESQETEYGAALIRCQCHWQRGEESLAPRMLQELIHKVKSTGAMKESRLYAVCLRICGTWLAHTRSQTPTIITGDFLKPAIDQLLALKEKGTKVDGDLAEAHYTLAHYADEQYKLKKDLFKEIYVDEGNILRENIKEWEAYEEMAKKKFALTYPQKRKRNELEKLITQAERDRDALCEEQRNFLKVAVENYLKCLALVDEFDMHIFRLCSLWFNASTELDQPVLSKLPETTKPKSPKSESEEVSTLIAGDLQTLKSHKWLRILYQLAANLGANDGKTPLQSTLHNLILQVARDHPHQSVYVLIALQNGEFNHPVKGAAKPKGKSATKTAGSSNERIQAATAVLNTLKTAQKAGPWDNPAYKKRTLDLPSLVEGMERLSAGYIQLADLHVDDDFKKDTKVYDNKFDLAHVHNARDKKRCVPMLQTLSVVSHELAIDPTCTYNDVVGIQEFEKGFKTAGGVNLPKIIICKGTNGKRYKQLVKGHDDIRQDAVMQQAFRMVNDWLQQDPATRKRRLKIGTYKVVPLSQLSGVLEWCDGTQPIGTFLTYGKDSAHPRYRPQDKKSSECRALMSKCKKKDLARTYEEVTKVFQPVMRRFFTEHFAEPAEWFERRLAYTRSVASSSIVGYVLGLGDRHPNNILIHNKTAEITHIDLGVAFDQGTRLNTPETVPFRLTRDIVDGMGVTGYEGVFRLCCVETMRLMRGSKGSMLTILEVFFNDPLYSFAVAPNKLKNLQRDEDNGEDGEDEGGGGGLPLHARQQRGESADAGHVKDAKRVLTGVEQKLDGVHATARLSIEGQVNCLINEATSKINLSQLFAGWQSWV